MIKEPNSTEDHNELKSYENELSHSFKSTNNNLRVKILQPIKNISSQAFVKLSQLHLYGINLNLSIKDQSLGSIQSKITQLVTGQKNTPTSLTTTQAKKILRNSNIDKAGSSKAEKLQNTEINNIKIYEDESPFEDANGLKTFQTENQGSRLTYEYTHEGNSYGTDIISRHSAVPDLISALGKQIKLLIQEQTQLKIRINNPNDPAYADANQLKQLKQKLEKIEVEIELCDHSLKANSKVSSEFISSQFFRDEMQKVVTDESQGFEKYQQAVNNIPLGAAVNFRHQTNDQTEDNFFRLGVITDLRNGHTSLDELKAFAAELAAANRGEIKWSSTALYRKNRELEKKYELALQESNNSAKLLALKFAIEQLAPLNLDRTIQERRHIMNNQMMQLVQAQVNNHPAHSDVLVVTHLGLLNRTTAKTDKTGWEHNEGAEMLDMNEIFAEFNNKTLIYDGKGPAIDADGRLHLAEKRLDENGNPLEQRLKTNFINFSVQKHNINDGIQASINEYGFENLLIHAQESIQAVKGNDADKNALRAKRQQGFERLLKIQAELIKGKSNYEMAIEFSIALLELDLPLSIGCLSAKDRTGFTGGAAMLHMLKKKAATTDKPLSEEASYILHKQIISKAGCAAQVIFDNTGIKILKCSSLNLPGITTNIRGVWKRCLYLIQQAATAEGAIPKLIGRSLNALNVRGVIPEKKADSASWLQL